MNTSGRSGSVLMMALLGWLLVGAALLKGYEFFRRPLTDSADTIAVGWRFAQVVGELFLGFWLLSGLYARTARLLSLAAFSLFALMNVFPILQRSASCGCFGPVRVDPRITFVLDLACVVGLFFFSPPAAQRTITAHPMRFAVFAVLAIALPAIGMVLRSHGTSEENYVVVDSQVWIGGRIPILSDIRIDASLDEGSWIVVFYRPECEKCLHEIPRFRQQAQRQKARLALLAVPPCGLDTTAQDATLGRFVETKNWAVRIPQAFGLHDGVVIALE